MFVYIHRYENLNVFSSPRKVLEFLKTSDWKVYDGMDNPLIEINDETISKLITKLNKEYFLQLECDCETSSIEKEEVQ